MNHQDSSLDLSLDPQPELSEGPMEKELRILILEDVAAHAELIERELREAKIVFTARRVATKEAFEQELEAFEPDLILADYSLPSFDGISALAIVQEINPSVPFV